MEGESRSSLLSIMTEELPQPEKEDSASLYPLSLLTGSVLEEVLLVVLERVLVVVLGIGIRE